MTTSPGDERLPLLTFRLAEQTYALHIRDVVEVASLVTLKTVPDAPDYLLGMVNRHGEPMPLIDLGRLFGHTAVEVRPDTVFIVVHGDDDQNWVGLVVDEVFQVKYMSSAFVRASRGTGRFIREIASDGQDVLQVVTLSAILAEVLQDH